VAATAREAFLQSEQCRAGRMNEAETCSRVEGPCRVATAEEDSGGCLNAGVGSPCCWYFEGVEKARLDTVVKGANVGG